MLLLIYVDQVLYEYVLCTSRLRTRTVRTESCGQLCETFPYHFFWGSYGRLQVQELQLSMFLWIFVPHTKENNFKIWQLEVFSNQSIPNGWDQEIGCSNYLIIIMRFWIIHIGNEWIVVQDNRLTILQVHVKPRFCYVTCMFVCLILSNQFLIQFWNLSSEDYEYGM